MSPSGRNASAHGFATPLIGTTRICPCSALSMTNGADGIAFEGIAGCGSWAARTETAKLQAATIGTSRFTMASLAGRLLKTAAIQKRRADTRVRVFVASILNSEF
jgi:hypothetical protein